MTTLCPSTVCLTGKTRRQEMTDTLKSLCGLISFIEQIYLHLKVYYRFRLELAMLSVQREIPMIRQLYDLLHLIWKTYHFSPKSMRELRVIGADLGVNVLVPSGVKGTRWLPHVSRALETFLKPGQFTTVYRHMDYLAGSSSNADIAGRATKVSALFLNILFILANYAIVIDFIFFKNVVHQCSR